MGQLYSRQSWRGGCVRTPSFEPFRLGRAAVVYNKDLSEEATLDDSINVIEFQFLRLYAWEVVSFLDHDALMPRKRKQVT
jgi:hypothetical protein